MKAFGMGRFLEMNPTIRTGLYLGKFAPFHRGHEYVIEQALKRVDRLETLIYDSPEVTSVPLNIRAGWIRTSFPQVSVIEGWAGPTAAGYTKEVIKLQKDYVKRMLGGKAITHFFSSEPYGEHMSRALGAEDCRLSRDAVPISATEIRADPFTNRKFLSPHVYRDLVANIVFLGGPSTGKSTIAEMLAKEYRTVFMPEYGREYWDTHQVDRKLTKEQLLEIAEGHIEREDRLLLEADRFLFTDTNAITTYLFSLYYHGEAHPKLEKLARRCASRYDLVFVCGDDIPFDDTWDRSGDASREVLQRQTLAYLAKHRIPYVMLRGGRDERIAKVKEHLKRFEKFSNHFGS